MPGPCRQMIMCAAVLGILGAAGACSEQAEPFEPLPQVTTRERGWLRGDLHLHTTWEDGTDTVGTTIDVAEYYQAPVFLKAHPEYAGNQLDYIAITDHNRVFAKDDPTFVSDKLILIVGEEYGATSHANIIGLSSVVPLDSNGDGFGFEDVLAASEAAHAQGAIMSINHIFAPNFPWGWDFRGMDAVEIWNSGWALASPGVGQELIDSWESERGPVSPMFRRGALTPGVLGSSQSLVYYEALLARGIHVGVIGGSDRHLLVMPGAPATYVRADAADKDGVIAGIAAGHSYVSRNPVAAQIDVELEVDGASYQAGDAIVVAEGGSEVRARLRVARAKGGVVRLVTGGPVASDGELATAELGTVRFEESITEDDQSFEVSWTASPGDWVYPLVLEPLLAPGLDDDEAALVRDLALATIAGGVDVGDLYRTYETLVDLAELDPVKCDPDNWLPLKGQCVLADQELPGSWFIPDALHRALNAVVEDGHLSDYCMGAVASAAIFVSEPVGGVTSHLAGTP